MTSAQQHTRSHGGTADARAHDASWEREQTACVIERPRHTRTRRVGGRYTHTRTYRTAGIYDGRESCVRVPHRHAHRDHLRPCHCRRCCRHGGGGAAALSCHTHTHTRTAKHDDDDDKARVLQSTTTTTSCRPVPCAGVAVVVVVVVVEIGYESGTQANVLPGDDHESATCVQRFDDSLIPAIHTTYRISLRSSSSREPRYPLLGVVIIVNNNNNVCVFFTSCTIRFGVSVCMIYVGVL